MATRRLALVIPPDRTVRQVLETDTDIGNPGMVWHDVTDQPQVKAGWTFTAAQTFQAPPPQPRAPDPPPTPTAAQLKAQLDALAVQIAALQAKS